MQRFDFRKVCWTAAVAVLMMSSVAANVRADGPVAVVHVDGGGTGLFIDPSITPTDQGLTTNFGVGATIYSDGTAKGHFTCLIPTIVVVDGQYTQGSYDEESGVATLSGVGILYFPTFEPIPVEFTNTFQAGGAGVGILTLSETSGYFPDYPNDRDTEVVIRGGIVIK